MRASTSLLGPNPRWSERHGIDGFSTMVMRSVARRLGWKGRLVVGAYPDGNRVSLVLLVDPHERSRREALGIGRISDVELLGALASLPIDIPIPPESLDAPTRSILWERAGPWVIDDGDSLLRVYRPPLSIVGVIVTRPSPIEAIHVAAACRADMAPACVVVSGAPNRAIVETAVVKGVGVAVAPTLSGRRWPKVITPPKAAIKAVDVDSWLMREDLYDLISPCLPQVPRTPTVV